MDLNTETGQKELSAVSNIFARKSENFVKLHFGTDSVACTPEHPFFVNNTWREAKDLKQGDSLFVYSGYKVALGSINTYRTDTATTVYNLEASGNHNFYVSKSGVLVHNCNAISAGNVVGKNGLTAAGRALQKHGSRVGSVFPKAIGNVEQINAQGNRVLNSIINHPNVRIINRHHARFGNIREYIAPNGGARFSADGKSFIGFIEP